MKGFVIVVCVVGLAGWVAIAEAQHTRGELPATGPERFATDCSHVRSCRKST